MNLWKHFHFPLSWPFFKSKASPPPPTPPSPLSSAFPAACCWLLAGVCCLLSAGPKFYTVEGVVFDFGSGFEFFGFWEISKNPEVVAWKRVCVCVCVCVQCAVSKFQINYYFNIIWQQTFNEFHQIYVKFCDRKKRVLLSNNGVRTIPSIDIQILWIGDNATLLYANKELLWLDIYRGMKWNVPQNRRIWHNLVE